MNILKVIGASLLTALLGKGGLDFASYYSQNGNNVFDIHDCFAQRFDYLREAESLEKSKSYDDKIRIKKLRDKASASCGNEVKHYEKSGKEHTPFQDEVFYLLGLDKLDYYGYSKGLARSIVDDLYKNFEFSVDQSARLIDQYYRLHPGYPQFLPHKYPKNFNREEDILTLSEERIPGFVAKMYDSRFSALEIAVLETCIKARRTYPEHRDAKLERQFARAFAEEDSEMREKLIAELSTYPGKIGREVLVEFLNLDYDRFMDEVTYLQMVRGRFYEAEGFDQKYKINRINPESVVKFCGLMYDKDNYGKYKKQEGPKKDPVAEFNNQSKAKFQVADNTPKNISPDGGLSSDNPSSLLSTIYVMPYTKVEDRIEFKVGFTLRRGNSANCLLYDLNGEKKQVCYNGSRIRAAYTTTSGDPNPERNIDESLESPRGKEVLNEFNRDRDILIREGLMK